nr:uncharacterized protein CTRU02_01847 [Colletotrichum truncatum]KAF6798976.1 hypothetical protein CTRU02_01847 [Colletotrichum truncatum]
MSWAIPAAGSAGLRHGRCPVVRSSGMAPKGVLDLTFLCTDDRFRGRGAGTALMRAVTKEAKGKGLQVFLESTMDAVPFYEKLGFVKVGGFRMSIPAQVEAGGVYEEVCMLLE